MNGIDFLLDNGSLFEHARAGLAPHRGRWPRFQRGRPSSLAAPSAVAVQDLRQQRDQQHDPPGSPGKTVARAADRHWSLLTSPVWWSQAVVPHHGEISTMVVGTATTMSSAGHPQIGAVRSSTARRTPSRIPGLPPRGANCQQPPDCLAEGRDGRDRNGRAVGRRGAAFCCIGRLGLHGGGRSRRYRVRTAVLPAWIAGEVFPQQTSYADPDYQAQSERRQCRTAQRYAWSTSTFPDGHLRVYIQYRPGSAIVIAFDGNNTDRC